MRHVDESCQTNGGQQKTFFFPPMLSERRKSWKFGTESETEIGKLTRGVHWVGEGGLKPRKNHQSLSNRPQRWFIHKVISTEGGAGLKSLM